MKIWISAYIGLCSHRYCKGFSSWTIVRTCSDISGQTYHNCYNSNTQKTIIQGLYTDNNTVYKYSHQKLLLTYSKLDPFFRRSTIKLRVIKHLQGQVGGKRWLCVCSAPSHPTAGVDDEALLSVESCFFFFFLLNGGGIRSSLLI